MLLACDIGNSYISIGVFEVGARHAESLQSHFNLLTDKKAKAQQLLENIRPKISERLSIDKLVIASVVPGITKEVATALGLLLEMPPKILTNEDIPVPNKYSQPNKVGTDRLLNAFGALKLYKPPIIIVDFGTATTFDVVSAKGEYLGGAIVPGVETSLEALFGKASKLEAVKLQKPSQTIGNTTEESIRSGVVIGTAGLVDKMVTEIEKDLGASTKIATGGLAELIIPYCQTVEIIESHLTLKAIAYLYDMTNAV